MKNTIIDVHNLHGNVTAYFDGEQFDTMNKSNNVKDYMSKLQETYPSYTINYHEEPVPPVVLDTEFKMTTPKVERPDVEEAKRTIEKLEAEQTINNIKQEQIKEPTVASGPEVVIIPKKKEGFFKRHIKGYKDTLDMQSNFITGAILNEKDLKAVRGIAIGSDLTTMVAGATVGIVYGKTVFTGALLGVGTMIGLNLVTWAPKRMLYRKVITTKKNK